MTVIDRVKSWLSAPRTPIRLAVLGLILGLPSLGAGFFMDDFAHRSAFIGGGQLAYFMSSPILMFSFTDGNTEHLRAAIESGLYPWWTSESVLLNFWRPLTAATHAIDYALWPDSPALMHAQNLFWFFVTILAVASLYKRIGSALWPAGLAGLLFVVDESHWLPVAWVANRNAILALFFGVLCLIAHIRWRESGKPTWLAAALAMLAVSVHCNEGGIATCGYLFAYAVILDKSSWQRRIATLVPYGILIVAWRILYSAMGFGAMGSPTYIDPGSSPGRFLELLGFRAPVLMATQLLNVPSEPYEFLPPTFKLGYWAFSVAVVVLCAAALWPMVRRSDRAQFWVIGMVLSLLPASATFPTGRLLLFASVGGAAMLAEYLLWAFPAGQRRPIAYRSIAYLFVLVHIIISPFALAGSSVGFGYLARTMESRFRAIEYPNDIAARRLFLINSPNYFFTTYANVCRSLDGLPVPLSTHTLSPNAMWPAKMTVTRVDEDTLHFRSAEGFKYLLFRDADKPFAVGDRVELEHLGVEILEVDEHGHAMAVNYHFRAPLESPVYYWMQIDLGMRFEPYMPPAIGETHIFYGD